MSEAGGKMLSMSASITADVVHHLYQWGPALDLIPNCELPSHYRNTGHSRDELLQCVEFGLPGCITCESPAALGGFTPLILSEAA